MSAMQTEPTPTAPARSPRTITVETSTGTHTFAKPGEVHAAIHALYQTVNGANLQQAKAYFALGEMLVKSHAVMVVHNPGVSIRHLIADAGVHHQKGKRAIKWYNALRDPEDGGFSMKLYREAVHEVREAVEQGTQRAKFDRDGNPSIRAISDRSGLNGPAARRGCLESVEDTCVPAGVCTGSVEDTRVPAGPYVDPKAGTPSGMSLALASLAAGAREESTQETVGRADDAGIESKTGAGQVSSRASSRASNVGASGSQLVLDFDFRADGRAIHHELDRAAAMLDEGTLDEAHAAGIKRHVDALTRYIQSLNDDEAVA